MTNPLTKQQVDEVIEKLVDKTLSFGCEVELLPKHCPFGKYLPIKARLAWFESDNFQTDSNIIDSEAHSINNVVGHPILKGTVAKKLAIKYRDEVFPSRKTPTLGDYANSFSPNILYLWGLCEKEGEELSLQEIARRIEWEDCKGWHKLEHPCDDKCQIVKPSAETDLLLFLKSFAL